MRYHEKDALIAVLMHYADPDMRRHLMVECPAAYNAYLLSQGRSPVVQVVHLSDGEPVWGQP